MRPSLYGSPTEAAAGPHAATRPPASMTAPALQPLAARLGRSEMEVRVAETVLRKGIAPLDREMEGLLEAARDGWPTSSTAGARRPPAGSGC